MRSKDVLIFTGRGQTLATFKKRLIGVQDLRNEKIVWHKPKRSRTHEVEEKMTWAKFANPRTVLLGRIPCVRFKC